MEELISVIIPVYNVEQYLARCVKSVLSQTYKTIEVILVDDGSTDNSGLLCDKLCKSDNRIKVIHQANAGLSEARNAGLCIAQGGVISFIDSDDYIDSTMLEQMYNRLVHDQTDLCICGVEPVYEDDREIRKIEYCELQDEVISSQEAQNRIFNWYYVTAWNKLYKSYIFDYIRFPKGRINEDEFVIHLIFDKCKRVSIIKENLYKYFQRANSIMNANKADVKRLDGVDAHIERYYYFKNKKNKKLYKAEAKSAYNLILIFSQAIDHKYKKEVKKKFIQVIKILFMAGDLRFIKLFIYYCKYIKNSKYIENW